MEKKYVKLIICGVLIFVVGIIAGYQLNSGKFSSLEGFLFNAAGDATSSNATSTNATSANATSANATTSNATSTNATSTNATSSNAKSTDNIIFLDSLELTSSNVEVGNRVDIKLVTSGACNIGASLVLKNDVTGTVFTLKVESLNDNPYVVIPNSVIPNSYYVSDILLVGLNSDNTSFTKQYNVFDVIHSNIPLNITKKEESNIVRKVVLNSISFEKSTVKVGEKVNFNIDSNEKLNSVKFVFTKDDGSLNIYASNLEKGNSYFEIPSTAAAGKYKLTSMVLSSTNASSIYSISGENNSEVYNFNLSLEINNDNEDKYLYNNEDINSDILSKIYNAKDGIEITINADSNSVIKEEVFDSIKGKNKKVIINYKGNQIIFNGIDVDTSKTIDVNMTVSNVNTNEKISKLVSDGVVVNFPDNGDLPGTALVRIKQTDDLKSLLSDKVYVYFYNELTNDFCVTNLNVKKSSDGYYEFSISHNSNYLIVNKKLDKKLVVEDDSNVVTFQKSNLTYLLLIGVALVVIVSIVVLIYVRNKKMNKE